MELNTRIGGIVPLVLVFVVFAVQVDQTLAAKKKDVICNVRGMKYKVGESSFGPVGSTSECYEYTCTEDRTFEKSANLCKQCNEDPCCVRCNCEKDGVKEAYSSCEAPPCDDAVPAPGQCCPTICH